jgi:hypothetical protein
MYLNIAADLYCVPQDLNVKEPSLPQPRGGFFATTERLALRACFIGQALEPEPELLVELAIPRD